MQEPKRTDTISSVKDYFFEVEQERWIASLSQRAPLTLQA